MPGKAIHKSHENTLEGKIYHTVKLMEAEVVLPLIQVNVLPSISEKRLLSTTLPKQKIPDATSKTQYTLKLFYN